MKKWSLWESLFFAPSYAEAARIIGYGGCTPFEFYDPAKELPDFDQMKFQAAVHKLARYTHRDASPSRCAFTDEAWKWRWGPGLLRYAKSSEMQRESSSESDCARQVREPYKAKRSFCQATSRASY